MSGKKKRAKIIKPRALPKYICQELRMTCALRSYSDMKCGKAKRLTEQYSAMSKFYHGRPPTFPSQIQLLSEGHSIYRELYEDVTTTSMNKNDNVSNVKKVRLKSTLAHDSHRVYLSGIKIRKENLEKKVGQVHY